MSCRPRHTDIHFHVTSTLHLATGMLFLLAWRAGRMRPGQACISSLSYALLLGRGGVLIAGGLLSPLTTPVNFRSNSAAAWRTPRTKLLFSFEGKGFT
jgi:hypothetical protein